MVSLVSELEKITWQILNLLIEEEKTLFSYSVPKISCLSSAAPRLIEEKILRFFFSFISPFLDLKHTTK